MLQHETKETTIVRRDFSVKKSELFLNIFKNPISKVLSFELVVWGFFSSVEASKNIFSVACYTP